MTDATNVVAADLEALKMEFGLLAYHFRGLDRQAKQSTFAQMATIKQVLMSRIDLPGADLSPEAASAIATMNFTLNQFASSLEIDNA